MTNRKIRILLIICILLIASFTQLDATKPKINNNSIIYEFLKPVHKPIFIDGDDDFTLDNGIVSGNGTIENPFIIANWNIRVSIIDISTEIDGISIKNTKSYFIIDNCFIHFLDGRLAHIITEIKNFYGSNGINLYNVSNGKIKNCFIIGMDGAINIENNSHNNLVVNCLCWHNYCGIGINRRSNNNSIESCKTCNFGCGICLWDNTSNNSIRNCMCRKVGINIYNSSNNTVTGCTLSNCVSFPAMKIFDNSHHNIIKNCNYYDNKHGLKICEGSYKNIIHHNNFIKNIKPAYDDSVNQWDNGTIGNYWSDYNAVDENMDGIWDFERPISGGVNKDRYPLVSPIIN